MNAKESTRCSCEYRAMDYVDRRMDESSRRKFEKHLVECEACAADVLLYQEFRESDANPHPDTDRILRRIEPRLKEIWAKQGDALAGEEEAGNHALTERSDSQLSDDSDREDLGDVIIDLGPVTTTVWVQGRGFFAEPSVVAVNAATRSVEAIGQRARETFSERPDDILLVRPIQEGSIDVEMASLLITRVFERHSKSAGPNSRVAISVPSITAGNTREALQTAAFHSQAGEVFLIDRTTAAAVGSGVELMATHPTVIVFLGDDRTRLAVVSQTGTIYEQTIPFGANNINESILRYVKEQHDVEIDRFEPEHVHLTVSADPVDRKLEIVIFDHVKELFPKTIKISIDELPIALSDDITVLAEAVRSVVERMLPDWGPEIKEKGIVITGHDALASCLDEGLKKELGIPVSVPFLRHPPVLTGIEKILNDRPLLNTLQESGLLQVAS